MKIAVAGDSAGLPLAKVLAEYLSKKYEVDEISSVGDGSEKFYAEMAARVAKTVKSGQYDRAILCCGTGIGVAIAANKVSGIRAAQVADAYSAGKAATSNNAQIITLGARTIASELAKTIVDAYLQSQFDENGSSASNVDAIMRIEAKER